MRQNYIMKKQQSKTITVSSSFPYEQVGYWWEDRLTNYQVLFAILFTTLFAFIVLDLVIHIIIFVLFLKENPFTSVQDPIKIVGIILGIFVVYQLAHTIFNLCPGIRISQKGLEVQVFDRFRYTWQFVPWPAVQAVYPVIKYGWFPGSQVRPTYVIEVDRLSAWHRRFSFMFGNGHLDAIIINPSFPRGERLLDKIRNYLYERDIENTHQDAG
jgi:hypothetical protein